jgi:hypothetical protein
VKHLVTAALVAVAAAALVAAIPADAARMGGGKSFGAQRQSVAPSKPDAPASGTTTNAMPATAPGAGAASNPVMPPPAGATAAAKPAMPGAAAPARTGRRAGSAGGGPRRGPRPRRARASHLGFSRSSRASS